MIRMMPRMISPLSRENTPRMARMAATMTARMYMFHVYRQSAKRTRDRARGWDPGLCLVELGGIETPVR